MPRKELGMAGSNSGSCDSMASTASNRSQRSDSSFDYLSVEEKECLMFLEETIGSLDAEGDSGVSTDDTDSGEPSKPRRGPVPRDLSRGAASPGPSASPGVPRNIPAANGASGSRAAPAVPAVPAANRAQDAAREGTKSVIIQPSDPFHDEHEWTRGHRSGAKDTKVRTSWGHPEKSPLEEPPQDPDAKRGPPTAPKPRKLPPNIILKTSRSGAVPLSTEHNQRVKTSPPPPAASQPSPAGDPAAEKSNSGHRDPKEKEKARREALEKLGLSRDGREPSAQPHPHPLPIPAESSVPGVRHMAFKSNTLERSGVGLASSMGSSKEQSSKGSGGSSSLGKLSFMERLAPAFLRGGRPRPVSLGAGKDFAGLQENEEQEKSSKRRSHPLPGFPRPSRSAVSVKITPKGAADENRREALKKLGLLKE